MEVLVCDNCGANLRDKVNILEVTPRGVFRMADDETTRHFCNWKCVAEYGSK